MVMEDASIVEHACGGGGTAKDSSRSNVSRPKRTARMSPGLQWFISHQISIGLFVLVNLIVAHVNLSAARPHTRKFLKLAYPDGGFFRQGQDDICFIFTWIVIFTVIRAVLIGHILQPVARCCGVPRKSQLRFAEQGWLALYYLVFWTSGMNIYRNSSYNSSHLALWQQWPTPLMSGNLKLYYLLQLAFWLQQIMMIHLEARRKDHAQMLTHHVITSSLLAFSYIYRFTNVGVVVLCFMDVVDLVFPIAKMAKYLSLTNVCNGLFVVFVASWFVARHILYNQLLYSIYSNIPALNTMQYGCYSALDAELLPPTHRHHDFESLSPAQYFGPLLNQGDGGVICLNKQVKWTFLAMLGSIQVLSLIWFGMIIKVIIGMLRGGEAEDTRSEDEDDGLSIEEETIPEKSDLERHNTQLLSRAQTKQSTTTSTRPVSIIDINVCASSSSDPEYDISTPISSSGWEGCRSLFPFPTTSFSSNRRSVSASSARSRGNGQVTKRRLPSLWDAEERKEWLARIGCDTTIGS